MLRALLKTSLWCALSMMLLSGVMLYTTACRHTVNSKNPQVVAIVAINDAMNICKTVHDGLQNADKTIDALQTQEPDYYSKAQPLLKKIRAANDIAVETLLKAQAGQSVDWKTSMLALSTTVSAGDLTTFGFKNPNTQLLVSAGVSGLEGVLLSIPSKLGGTQ